MIKAALASAVLLATVGLVPASAQSFYGYGAQQTGQSKTSSISVGQIATLKAALRLTPAQERYWPAAEAALRRFSAGAISAKRAMAVASPLIRALSPNQRQTAVSLARAAGLDQLAAAF